MGAVKLNSVFRYPGGKSKMLPVIMEHLEPMIANSDNYIEPFIGGGSVMLHLAANYPNLKIYINDKNYGIFCFWSIVTGNDASAINELLSLIDQKPTLELHSSLRSNDSVDYITSAYKSLFFNRCNFSGIEMSGCIGGQEQKGKYKIDCRYNPDKIKQGIKKINAITRDRVTVSNCDIADYSTLWNTDYPAYLDPPYRIKGKMLYSKYMEVKEHEVLADKLNHRKNWLLSYDDCQEIKNLYSNNQIISFDARYSINGSKTQWANKKEILIKDI
jgi:DNA adenine methylase